MANCHPLFLEFTVNISLLKSKKDRMISSRETVRNLIRNHFILHHPEYEPMFFIQGSNKMGLPIRNGDDTCDLDDGVYFLRKPDISPTTLQKWVLEAVQGHTSGGQQHRKKCIRVIYVQDYHIDLPVYYKSETDKHPFLAVKDTGWESSDPREFVKWFVGQKDKKGQLVRIIKALKAWCDKRERSSQYKMPSGLCMTLLACNHIAYNDRDDLALRDTLKNIQRAIDDTRFKTAKWTCKMPTTPFDDLFEKYDVVLKRNFLAALDNFYQDAQLSIQERNERKASLLWRKHLGERFPLGEDKEDSAHLSALREIASTFSSSFLTPAGGLTTSMTQVGYTYHRNHGDEADV